MALINCKECGEEVSSKVKACPKCGVETPKKSSLGKWLVLLLIILVIYGVYANTDSKIYPTSTSEKAVVSVSAKIVEKQKKVEPPKPSWATSISKDEMTGKISAYTHSPSTVSSKGMTFPYGDVSSWMGIGCDGQKEWAYFGFDSSPNLANDETKDGYNLIVTRIKWNKDVGNVTLTQDWGSKFIHFRDGGFAISKAAASNTVMLELQWHGQQPTYFNYTLNGSSKALSEIRAVCSKNK